MNAAALLLTVWNCDSHSHAAWFVRTTCRYRQYLLRSAS